MMIPDGSIFSRGAPPALPSRECSPWSELKGCPLATFAPTPDVRPGSPGPFGADLPNYIVVGWGKNMWN